jgi:hypothetical protein
MANCIDDQAHGRDTEDDHLVDAEVVKESDIGIGLHRGRDVGGQGGTKIAKTGRSDKPISAPGQRAGHVDALIEAAAGAVDDQHRLALTHQRVFQCAKRGLHRLAATCETVAGA